jgi:hypothetical protein
MNNVNRFLLYRLQIDRAWGQGGVVMFLISKVSLLGLWGAPPPPPPPPPHTPFHSFPLPIFHGHFRTGTVKKR